MDNGLFAFWKFKLPRRNMITATNFELFIFLKKGRKKKKIILFLSLFSDLVNFKSKGFNYVWSKTLFMFSFKMEYEFYLHKYLMQFVITCICD